MAAHIQKNNYADWLFEDSVDSGRIRGEQQQTIYADRLLNLETFGDTHDWFTTLFNFGFSGIDAYEDLKEIAPIYKVTASDILATKTVSEIASSLYVTENDVEKIRLAYNEAVLQDEMLFLFRFAATDYYAEDITHFFKDGEQIDCNGYIAQETVFLGFDVISLTFFDDGISTVIPVASSPIDIIDDITNPNVPGERDFSWLKRILMLALIIVLIVMFWNPLMEILGWIIDVVMDIMTGFRYTKKPKKRRKRK